MEGSTVNGMCRCCASEGAFKDIKTSYHWMGEEEVYADMLRECFEVTLSSADQGGICEVCITQLRNAANFKKQVLNTESQFKQHLRNKGFKGARVKEELSGFDDNDSDDMDNGDDEDYVPEYEIPIKTESESEEKPKKRSAKAVSTRAKKSKTSDGDAAVKSFLCNVAKVEIKKEVKTEWGLTIKKVEIDEDAVNERPETKAEYIPQITKLNFRLRSAEDAPINSKRKPRSTNKKKLNDAKVDVKHVNTKITNIRQVQKEISPVLIKGTCNVKTKATSEKVELKERPEVPQLEVRRLLEVDKHRYNLSTILQCSNATPIRAHFVGNGYACCFCDQFFLKAADLKQHTIQKHDEKENTKLMRRPLSVFVVKLDITALRCNLCEAELNTLEDLITHLKEKHNKTFYTDIKSQIICFKLDNEELKCMYCQIECSSFKPLLEHMNQHYTNYVCDVCGAGFVTERMLGVHADGHKQGHFDCDVCKKVFDTLRSLKYHLRTAHSNLYRYKCFQCQEKFATVRLKKEHMVEAHGAEFAKLPCLACDKSFKDKNALRVHTQRDHLMERRFICTACDKKFYTNELLKNHLVIHTGLRDFKCEICGKDFARKKTLLTHMRTHK